MTLRAARILSSETDNTIKQEQNTNVNIKITPRQQSFRPQGEQQPQQQPVPGNVNFTQANQPQDSLPAGQALHTQTTPESLQYPSAAVTNSNSLLAQDRGIRLPGSLRTESVADLGLELDTLEKKNRFLELLVEMYSENPLKVNSYVVCKSGTLMSMIKLLTECDKVDFVLDDYEVGCGCGTGNAKLIKIDKILVTKDGRTEELKYCYNDIYTEFIKYGLSLKFTV